MGLGLRRARCSAPSVCAIQPRAGRSPTGTRTPATHGAREARPWSAPDGLPDPLEGPGATRSCAPRPVTPQSYPQDSFMGRGGWGAAQLSPLQGGRG